MINHINLNLLFLLLLCGQQIKAQGRFEDADHGTDFGSRFGDNGQWDIRHNIPGEPDVDYPIYSIVPRTSFTCENRHEGYYADIEARCQAFRICANTAIEGDGFAFLCPNGTLFSQRKFICDWYKNVDCVESENYYFMNEEIGKAFNNKEEMLEAAMHMIEFPLRNATNVLTTKATTPFPRTTQRPQTTPPTINKITTFKPAITFGSFTTRSTTRPTFTMTTTQRPFTTTQRINSFNKNGNNKNEVKDKRPTTTIPITKEESESADLTSVVPPGNVYVSNLGELSTDIGSTFDPKSSVIIGKGSQEPEAGLIDIRGSFGDTSKISETHDVFRQNIDNVRNSFPANVNSFLSTPESQSAIKSGHAVSYQIQNRYTAPQPSPQAAASTLTLAEKINAGLNGFAKISVAGNSNNDYFANKVHSGEGNLITHSYNKLQPSGKSLNFADSINSAFQQGAAGGRQSSYAFSDRSSLSTVGETRGSGNAFTKQSQGGPHRIQVDDFRRGRQFQFQGIGFSRGRQGVGNDQRNAYLPPSGQRNTAGAAFATQYETFETSSLEPTYSADTVPNLLINVEDDDDPYLDTRTLEENENDVHVKKRAEHLLLQGVHLTRYENDISDFTDYNVASSINSELRINTPRTYTTSSTTTKTTTDLITSTEKPRTTTAPIQSSTTETNAMDNISLSTETSLTKTLIYTFTQPKQDIEKVTPTPTGRFSFSINNRRQTARPLAYTKKPSVQSTRTTTRTVNSSSRGNLRRRPTHKFSSRYSITQKPTVDDIDLIPEANSYGHRSNFNSIKNETRKYTTLKRTKISQDTRTNVHTPRSRSRISVVSFNSTGNTVTTTKRPTTTTTKPTTTSYIIPEIKFDFAFQQPAQTQGTTGVKETTGQGGAQGFTSTLNGFKIFPSQQHEDSKKGSSYVEIPGTKIEIAKSQEQGHFTVSNDPNRKQGYQPSQTPGSGYQPLDQYLKDTFPGQKPQEQNYQQTYHQQTHQKNSNLYLPFPTVSTTKRPAQTGSFQIFPSVSQQIPSAYGPSSTTRAPYYTQTPKSSSFSIGTKVFSPFLEGIPIQRRLDIVEDDKDEGSLYSGVSSYNVPISSVGRLPGDLVALRKRRRS